MYLSIWDTSDLTFLQPDDKRLPCMQFCATMIMQKMSYVVNLSQFIVNMGNLYSSEKSNSK